MHNYQPYFDIADIIAKQLRGVLSNEDKKALDNWLLENPRNQELYDRLLEQKQTGQLLSNFPSGGKELAWARIAAQTRTNKQIGKTRFSIKKCLPYAAAIFLVAVSGVVIHNYLQKKETVTKLSFQKIDLLPGTNKATLTLADGTKILLDDAKKGNIAHQPDVSISKAQSGQLVYQPDNAEQQTAPPNFAAAIMNTLTTPRGGQYEIVLPDGTRVWLNAASSLTFPTLFTGNSRNVTLTGEAYFEVAKNTSKPFFVKSKDQTLKVLGTHFNINSYTDEQAVKTTLLEGSINIAGNGHQVKLSPGQQAVNGPKEIDIVKNADVDEAIAWKNGKFLFRNAELKAIMRQLSRWYDVDVEYQGNIAETHYRGHISRNVPVSQVFEILKTSGVNFTINGRKIIVKS